MTDASPVMNFTYKNQPFYLHCKSFVCSFSLLKVISARKILFVYVWKLCIINQFLCLRKKCFFLMVFTFFYFNVSTSYKICDVIIDLIAHQKSVVCLKYQFYQNEIKSDNCVASNKFIWLGFTHILGPII